ncbi:Peptidyl-prolyl cis-trans isomerase-like 4 [Blastocladiella emersonii ATCC 22665]|nr:Peptidyl-prolyl cis-trans isomerase-like 4 [Blastocladiella emersonii ATCC 22665]
MSVLLETSLGDIVVDLLVDECPRTCTNFLKLCKIKYYNFNLFFNVQRDLLIQTGDPEGSGSGGQSVWGVIESGSRSLRDKDAAKKVKSPAAYFPAEVHPSRKHTERGLLSMAIAGADPTTGRGYCGSQFILTTGDKCSYLDGRAAVFGRVAEGMDVIDKINNVFVDEKGRPFQDVRIKHTIILDDPFPDPDGLEVPDRSPDPPREALEGVRLAEDEVLGEDEDPAAVEERRRKQEASSHALTLEMMGDLPFAEIKPPENILFVCKLNPVTRDEDLELIFSRFGKINSCEVVRAKDTGESLSYAFIEFDDRKACEAAYFKMDNVLIDDRRIKVDFSQSVSKLHRDWLAGRKRRMAGFGGFSNLQRRTQYREEDGIGGSGSSGPNTLIFEHDSDLRAGLEVPKDGEHEVEGIPLSPRSRTLSITSVPPPPPPAAVRPHAPSSRSSSRHDMHDRRSSRDRSSHAADRSRAYDDRDRPRDRDRDRDAEYSRR